MSTPRPRRVGAAIAAGLLLPLALGAGAALPWLAGWIAAQRRAESGAAAERLAAVGDAIATALRDAAGHPTPAGFVIVRRADGGAGWPFVAAGGSAPPPALDDVLAIHLALGRAAIRRDDSATAAEHFMRARQRGPVAGWPPADGLAAARAFAATGAAVDALAVVDEVAAAHAEHWFDLVSVPAAAATLTARIAADSGRDGLAARAVTEVLTGRVAVDPRTAVALVAALRTAGGTALADARFEPLATAFRRAAAAADRDWRSVAVDVPHPLPDGGAVIATTDRLVVFGPTDVTAAAAAALASHRLEPFRAVQPDDPEAIVRRPWPPLALALGPAAPSRRYAQLTWTLGGAAGIALLLGQWLAWRLARREIALARLKSDFVDLVGHELRTPLAALAVKAEMLAHGDVAAERAAAWQRDVHRAAQRLGGLLDRLLDFARLEKGRFPLERRPIAARTLLARGIAAGRDALRFAGRRLTIDVPRVLPELRADAELLSRALANLLDNACRHGAGRVSIVARASGGGVDIRVLDEGPGLGGERAAALSEPFRRGRHAGPGGAGLGLAIVARAVRAHGGRLSAADRSPGPGAEFRIWLPAAEESS